MRGDCLTVMKKLNEAVDDFRKVLDLDPDSNKDDRIRLIRALYSAERFTEAVDGEILGYCYERISDELNFDRPSVTTSVSTP